MHWNWLRQVNAWRTHLVGDVSLQRKGCGSKSRRARCRHDVGMHLREVAVAEHVVDGELLVRKLGVILKHPLLQRRESCGKVPIVVLALHIYLLLICFVNATDNHELQKLYSGLLVIFHNDISLTTHHYGGSAAEPLRNRTPAVRGAEGEALCPNTDELECGTVNLVGRGRAQIEQVSNIPTQGLPVL